MEVLEFLNRHASSHLLKHKQTSYTGTPEITVCQDFEEQSASVHRFSTVTMMQEDNLTTNVSCQIHDGILSPFLPIGYIIICCIGLLCNTVTLYIFFLRRQTDSSMTVYMRHLALADTLLVMCLPLRVYYHNKEGPFYLCKVVGIFFYINMYSSILFLSLISLDRYLKIIKPVWVRRIQKTKWSHMARLCFLPYHAIRIPYVLAQMNVIGDLQSQRLLHILNESTLQLSALNSCLDPIIYYFLSSAYQKTILCVIQGKFKNMYALNRRRISINRSLTEI
ncbi:P2Y purinoceptor 4-like [Sinocyclocheilus anshuiensis]|uniref:P2Y purinoceptor 4-like n=1 Tax=Sinocyclocheilus anshuiensis TaxID=1608454 RepID=UPI0007B82BA0|nr:PREDICTED: P2Y purinoceptor 4-like [Sinocyclocheilus anshuiensis]